MYTPIKRKVYALVKGIGYHKLEAVMDKPITYTTHLLFQAQPLGIEN
jgi:hypothetical protein